MGNSNRKAAKRESLRKSTVTAVEVSLAPTQACSTDEDGAECPICFSNYTALNQTKCCTELICTDCFIQVTSNVNLNSTCSFCGIKPFAVTYDPKRSFKTPAKMQGNNISGKSDEISSAATRRDSSPGAGNVIIPQASVADRQSIEQEIMKSQKVGDIDFLQRQAMGNENAFQRSRSSRSRHRHNQSSHLASLQVPTASSALSSTSHLTPRSLSRHSSNRSLNNSVPHSEGSDSGDDYDDIVRRAMRTRAAGTGSGGSEARPLASLLQAPNNLQDLEDLMMMEAIRLSMQDSSTPAQASASSRISSSSSEQNDASSASRAAEESPRTASTSSGNNSPRPILDTLSSIANAIRFSSSSERNTRSHSPQLNFTADNLDEARARDSASNLGYDLHDNDHVDQAEQEEIMMAIAMSLQLDAPTANNNGVAMESQSSQAVGNLIDGDVDNPMHQLGQQEFSQQRITIQSTPLRTITCEDDYDNANNNNGDDNDDEASSAALMQSTPSPSRLIIDRISAALNTPPPRVASARSPSPSKTTCTLASANSSIPTSPTKQPFPALGLDEVNMDFGSEQLSVAPPDLSLIQQSESRVINTETIDSSHDDISSIS